MNLTFLFLITQVLREGGQPTAFIHWTFPATTYWLVDGIMTRMILSWPEYVMEYNYLPPYLCPPLSNTPGTLLDRPAFPSCFFWILGNGLANERFFTIAWKGFPDFVAKLQRKLGNHFLTLTRIRVSSLGIERTLFSTSASVTSIKEQLEFWSIMGNMPCPVTQGWHYYWNQFSSQFLNANIHLYFLECDPFFWLLCKQSL